MTSPSDGGGSTHRHALGVLFSVGGEDGRGVTVTTDPADVVLTGDKVLRLETRTNMNETEIPRVHKEMSAESHVHNQRTSKADAHCQRNNIS